MRLATDKLRCVCMLTVLNVLCLQAAVFASEGIRWAPDLKSAQQASAQFGVPVLVHFWGEDCLPCKTLDTRVFSKPELIDTLNKYFICVRVNASEHKQLAANYGVHSWPTDVFLSPQGQVLYQGVCPQNVETYKGVVQNVAIMNRDNNALYASQQAAQQASPKTTMQQNYASPQTQQASTPNPQTLATGQQMAPQQMSAQQGYVGQTANPGLPPRNNANFTQTADGSAKLLPPPEEMGKYAQYDAQPVQYSRPPAESVLSGPLDMNAQPRSIQTAMQPVVNTPRATNQAAQANAQANNNQVKLPPRSMVGMVPPANPMSAGTQADLNQISSMPVMTTKQPEQPKSNPVFRPASNVVATSPGKTVSNPYFHDTHSYSAPKQPNVSPGQFVAQSQTSVPAPNATAPPQLADTGLTAEIAADTAINAGSAYAPGTSSGVPNQASTEIALQEPTQFTTPQAQPVQAVPESSNSDSTIAFQSEANSNQTSPSTQPSDSHLAVEDSFEPRQEETSETGLSSEGVAFAQASNNVVEGEIGLVEESPALEGYCPIALVTRSDWVDGSKEFKVRHRGKWYWLSSAEAKKQFLKSPDESSPLVSGYDPYILLEEGRLVEGSIQYGLHEQISGVFMLFSSPENKQKYWDDYDRYSKALEALVSRARKK